MSELANGTAPPGMQVGGFSYVPSAWGARFHARTEDEVFGAGAAGPGKTTVLMMDPLSQIWIETLRCQRCDIPDSFDAWTRSRIENNPISWGHSQGWILHLRRTLPRLSETIQRAHRVFNQIEPGVQWIERSSKFVFKSGLVYEFGHCKDRADYNNYLGKSYTYIAFDELIEFTKDQYDFICSRLRTSDPVLGSMLKIRSMSNPRMSFSKGTDIALDDPAWVKRYFVDPAPEGNKIIRKKIVRRDGTTSSSTRLYLPATLYDNPDKEFVKQYEAQLMSRPKHIRDCYLYGRWDLVLGAFLDEIWNPEIHVCKPFKIPASWPVFRACDWGYRSNGIICWLAQSPEGTLFVFHEAVFKEKTARYVAEKIVKPFEERNRLWDGSRGSKITGPADTQIWEERGESASNKYLEFQQAGVDWVRADKRSRATNAEVFVGRLNDHDNFTKEPGIVFFETCVNCTKTIPSMETDHHDIEAPRKGGWDHAWDCITYACQYAKQVGMDAPKYEPTFAGEDDEPQDKIADGPSYWWG